MLRLWQRMSELHGQRWEAEYGPAQFDGALSSTVRTWQRGLAGYGHADLRRGFDRCLKAGWQTPPSLPRFRALCALQPSDLGIPNLPTAYLQAAASRPSWSDLHPIVWHLRQAVGVFELRTQTRDDIWPTFERAYNDLVQRLLAGEVLEIPERLAVPQLPHQPTAVITAPGSARAHCQALLARLRASGGI